MELDAALIGKTGVCLALLGLGIGFAWLAAKILPVATGAVSVSLIITPLLAYLIVSGLVTDFAGFGVSAKFASIARTPVNRLLRAEEIAISDKLANDPNYLRDAMFAACRSYYLLREDQIPAANSPEFTRVALQVATAIHGSLTCGRLQAVIVLDKKNRVLGYFEPALFAELTSFRLESYGVPSDDARKQIESLPDLIATSELGVILRDPAIRAESQDARQLRLGESRTILEALGALLKAGAPVAVITNDTGEFKGVITWQRLVGELLINLTGTPMPGR